VVVGVVEGIEKILLLAWGVEVAASGASMLWSCADGAGEGLAFAVAWPNAEPKPLPKNPPAPSVGFSSSSFFALGSGLNELSSLKGVEAPNRPEAPGVFGAGGKAVFVSVDWNGEFSTG
jgi:hypothetical protein